MHRFGYKSQMLLWATKTRRNGFAVEPLRQMPPCCALGVVKAQRGWPAARRQAKVVE
jgi:hypothetical protein